MRTIAAFVVAAAVSVLAVTIQITPVHAQATRTWVSSSGSDGNGCSQALPCLTFSHALSVTSAGGEISCLTPGDFGGVIIQKAISIDCAGTGAFISNGFCPFVNGTSACGAIIVEAGATDVVRLRGLSLMAPSNILNDNGIRFVSGAALHVRNCVIANYSQIGTGGVGNSGMGIWFNPASGTTASLYVQDTILSNNGLSQGGGGIVVQPVGSVAARVELNRVAMENNFNGFFANATLSSGIIGVQIRDTVVTGSASNGIAAFASSGAASITVDHSSSNLNLVGIFAHGASAFVFLNGATVMSNQTGLSSEAGGSIFSYQNNAILNGSDAAPTGTIGPK